MNELEKMLLVKLNELIVKHCANEIETLCDSYKNCSECQANLLAKAITDNGYVKPVDDDTTDQIYYIVGYSFGHVELDGKRYRQVWILDEGVK